MNKVGAVLALVTMSIVGAACGGEDAPAGSPPAYDVVREATLEIDVPAPAPTGDVVLTITGAITRTNVGNSLQFDLAMLDSLRVVEYETPDMQAEGGVVTFSGVLVTDLLEYAGADAVTALQTVALNDYKVEIPAADLEHAVMLATRVNGQTMSVERYGPTRIVYPYGTDDLDPTEYDPRWIWQLASIDVE